MKIKVCILISMISLFAVVCIAVTSAQASAWKQDRFMVTFWCSPPATDENLAAVAAEGYNLIWAPADKLDVVAKHGLKALVQDPLLTPSTFDDPAGKQRLLSLIESVKSHPALEGYFLTDEPATGKFPGLARLIAFLKEHDPKHLAYVNLSPTFAEEQQLGVTADEAERQQRGIPLSYADSGDYSKTILVTKVPLQTCGGWYARGGDYKTTTLVYREHLRRYVQIVKPDLISYDHYHFLSDGTDGAQYFLNLGLIRDASQSADVPFLNIIQADTIVPAWRLVDKHELRWLVYTTLAYGGRGISYFTYWGPASYGGLYQDGKRMPLALDAAEINYELKTVGREMMKLKSTGVYHTAPLPVGGTTLPPGAQIRITSPGQFVIGFFSHRGKADTFMIVNRDYKNVSTLTVQLPKYVNALSELNRKSGKWEPYASVGSSGVAEITIQPGDGRLMRMVNK